MLMRLPEREAVLVYRYVRVWIIEVRIIEEVHPIVEDYFKIHW